MKKLYALTLLILTACNPEDLKNSDGTALADLPIDFCIPEDITAHIQDCGGFYDDGYSMALYCQFYPSVDDATRAQVKKTLQAQYSDYVTISGKIVADENFLPYAGARTMEEILVIRNIVGGYDKLSSMSQDCHAE